MTVLEELKNHKTKYNKAMIDRAIEYIEYLEKKISEVQSGKLGNKGENS